jgi:hypothetical protein
VAAAVSRSKEAEASATGHQHGAPSRSIRTRRSRRFDNLTITTNLNSYVASDAETTSGGLGAGTDGMPRSIINFGAKVIVDGDLTAGNALNVLNNVDSNAVAKSARPTAAVWASAPR